MAKRLSTLSKEQTPLLLRQMQSYTENSNDVNAHAAKTAVEGHAGAGAHNHQIDLNGGKLDHGLSLNGLLDDDHTQYASANGSGTRSAYMAERLNKSVTGVNGLSGGGLMTADQELAVNQGYAFNWTGAHTFQNDMNAQSILPRATDTYDLGSSTLLWRKGWLSELDAVLFAQNTVTLLGGWFMISKSEGALPADVAAAATTINFGQAMTNGHFVLFRAALKMEYVQVGALVSGTTYNVTRNLDGSGANDWPAGTPYAILGTNGDGRIELNAYDTPRISVIRQGATYNAQTEDIRLGDLASWQGAGLTGFGAAMGSFAGNEYLYYTPGSGLVVRGTVRADDGYLQNLTVQGLLSLNTTGELRAGDTTNGLRFGYLSDGYYLRGVGGGYTQVEIRAADGKLRAGALTLERYGARMSSSTSWSQETTYGFLDTEGNWYGGLGGLDEAFTKRTIELQCVSPDKAGQIRLLAESYSNYGEVVLTAAKSPNYTSITLNSTSGIELGRKLLLKYDSWGAYTGDGGATIANDNGTYKALMLVGNNSAGSGRRHVYVYDDLFVWGSIRASTPILCKVRRTSNQTIPSGGWTAVVFDAADAEQPSDLDMWWSGNGSAMYAKVEGWYHFDATVEFASSSAGTARGIAIYKNGAEYGASQFVSPRNGIIQLSVSWTEYMSVDNYVQLIVYQDSGGNLNAVGDTSGNDKTTLVMYKLI